MTVHYDLVIPMKRWASRDQREHNYSSDERIARFESSAQLQLPSEYREFLKRYGNTVFEEFVEYPFIDKECPWAESGYGGISVFYGLDAGPYDLEKRFASHIDRIPRTCCRSLWMQVET